MTRRIAGCCAYCGARLRHERKIACAAHGDLPPLDPHHQAEAIKAIEQPPDLPILILTRRKAA